MWIEIRPVFCFVFGGGGSRRICLDFRPIFSFVLRACVSIGVCVGARVRCVRDPTVDKNVTVGPRWLLIGRLCDCR